MVAQFKLRNLFAAIALIASILASVRVSLLASMYFGVPIGWLVYRLLNGGPAAVRCSVRTAFSSSLGIAAVGGAFICTTVVCGLGWRPHNAATCMFLVGANLWQIFIFNLPLKPWLQRMPIVTLPLWASVYVVFWLTCGHEDMPPFAPGGGWYYVDFATDRHRVTLWPELDFYRAGSNHSLIQRHSSAATDNWVAKAVIGQGHVLGGGDRVDTKSVLLRPTLPAILGMLPSEEARRQVIAALGDRKNLARVHQGLLLTWVAFAGAKDAGSRDNWWDGHRELFVSVPDPQNAARLSSKIRNDVDRYIDDATLEMSEEAKYELNVQFRAAWWHERGFYDEAFAGAFHTMSERRASSNGNAQ